MVKSCFAIKGFFYIGLLLVSIACNHSDNKTEKTAKAHTPNQFRIYSKSVADSFSVFVNLPNNYDPQQNDQYPVVYLLDANLYFDVVASVLNKYSEVGLAPSVILVGIGYKDFPTIDSLRNRDDTYPTAIPEYEMSISGALINSCLSLIRN